MVDKAKKRLQALGFFKTVEIKRRPGLRTRPRRSRRRAGRSSPPASCRSAPATRPAEGVIGDVSITERNLMGTGSSCACGLAGSCERLQIDLSFTEPRFLDRNLAAGFDLFHKTVDQSRTNQQFCHAYDRRLGAARLPAGGEHLAGQFYTLSNNEISDVAGYGVAGHQEAEGTYWTSAWGTHADAMTRAITPEPDPRLCICKPVPSLRALAAMSSTSAPVPRAASTIPIADEDNLRRPRRRRTYRGLGWPGRAPARSVLQGR